MTSIFERALGADFTRLHPMMQKRFGVGLSSGYACVGRGTLTITRGPWWTVPFLQFGRLRNILTPVTGVDVPFTVENYPYRDPLGRETVTFVREYRAGRRPTRFDATMVLGARGVLDYLGTHQHLAVDSSSPWTPTADCAWNPARSASTRARSRSGSPCSSAATRAYASGSMTKRTGTASRCA